MDEGRIEELVMEGKKLKEDKEKEIGPVSCLHVILVHATLQCLNAVYGKCFKHYICINGVCKSIIHGVARIFTSLLLQAASGMFAGLPTYMPYALALAAISAMFTNEELGSLLPFKSKKSNEPGLDPKRVEIFLEELDHRFPTGWNLKTLKAKIIQKCRDICNKVN